MDTMDAMAGLSHDEHDQHDQHDEAAAPVHASTDCKGTCGDCQLCHSVAMALWPAFAVPLDAPRNAPAFAPAAFASTAPAPGLKPPIS